MNRTELDSFERMALGLAWYDAKNAVALTCELIRWALPPVRWLPADAPEVRELEQRLGCEQPMGGDPYRTAGTQRVNADPPEVTDARFAVALTLSYIAPLANGTLPDPPADYGQPGEHPLTRLYWFASVLGNKTVEACIAAGHAVFDNAVTDKDGWKRVRIPAGIAELRAQWVAVGGATRAATEFIRKFTTNNPMIGELDGAAGNILLKISHALTQTGKPTEEIMGRMFHWRIKDALKGRELTPELDANLRPAFEAAWSAGEYAFAYSLLADVSALLEQA